MNVLVPVDPKPAPDWAKVPEEHGIFGVLLPDPAEVWGFDAPPAPAPTVKGTIPDLPALPHHVGLTPEQEIRKLRWELSMAEDSIQSWKRQAVGGRDENRALRDHLLREAARADLLLGEVFYLEGRLRVAEWHIGRLLVRFAEVGVRQVWRLGRR